MTESSEMSEKIQTNFWRTNYKQFIKPPGNFAYGVSDSRIDIKEICDMIATKKAVCICMTENLPRYAEVSRGQLAGMPTLPRINEDVRDIDQVFPHSPASARRWRAQTAMA